MSRYFYFYFKYADFCSAFCTHIRCFASEILLSITSCVLLGVCAIIFPTVSYEAFGITRDRLAEELWRIP